MVDITTVEKTTGKSTTASTSHATASVTPVSNLAYLLWVESASATTGLPPIGVTGLGITWVKITEATSPNNSQNLSVWAGLASSVAAGPITMTWAAATEFVAWKLTEHDNIDPADFIRDVNIGTLPSSALNPSFNLPTSVSTGNAVISGIAYAGGSTQTLTADTAHGYAATGGIEVASGSPVGQLGVEFNANPTNNTIVWNSTNLGSKAIIAIELIAVPLGHTAQVNIVEKLSNGSTTALSAYTTGSATPTNGRGYLLWVTSTHATAAVAPTTVTGMGMTWVKISSGTTSNGQLNHSVWRASVPSGSSAGALTITFPSAMATCAWKLDELTGQDQSGTNGSGFIRTANNFLQVSATSNPSGTLANAPLANSGVIVGLGYFAGTTQSMSIGGSGNYTMIGTPVSLASSNPNQLGTEYDITATSTTVDWSSTSGAGKVMIALELLASSGSPLVNVGGDMTVEAFDSLGFAAVVSGGTSPFDHSWSAPGLTLVNPLTASPSVLSAPASRTTQTYTVTDTVTDGAAQVGSDSLIVTVLAHNQWTWRGATPGGALVARRKGTRRSGSIIR
jgi:hypothetical protein